MYITVFLYYVCDNLIIDVGLHGCLELIWKIDVFSLMIKGPIWCFTYAFMNRYGYFMFSICLNDQQWSAAHELPSHDDKCCKWCVLFHTKSSVLFSPKLLNSECVLPSSIAVTLSTVLVLPCSLMWLNTEYWVVYLLFSVKAMRYKLFYRSLVLLSFL